MSDVYNASDRRQVREAAKQAKAVEASRRVFVTELMSTVQGRAWILEEILLPAHIFSISNIGNALHTAFAEGERNMGLRVLNSIMQACPDQYVVMMREYDARNSAAGARHTTAAIANGRDQRSEPDESDDDATGGYDSPGG